MGNAVPCRMALRRRILPCRTAKRTVFIHFAGNFVKILQKLQKTLVLYIGVRYIIYYEKIGENAGILSNSTAPFQALRKTKENQWEELMESKNRSTAAAAPELPGRRLPARPWKRKNTGAEPTTGAGRHAALAAWRIYGGGPRYTYRGGGPSLTGCRRPSGFLPGTRWGSAMRRCRQRALFTGEALRRHSMLLPWERDLTGCLKKTKKTDDRGR